MSASLQFVEAVKNYALPLGLEAEFEDDACVWQASDGLTLTIRVDPDGAEALLRTPVGAWPPDDEGSQEENLRTLLAANLMGVGSRGAVFAIDEDAGEIILYRRLSCADATAETVAQAIDDLHAAAVELASQASLPSLG